MVPYTRVWGFFANVLFTRLQEAACRRCAVPQCCSDSVLDVADVNGAFGFLHWLLTQVRLKNSIVLLTPLKHGDK